MGGCGNIHRARLTWPGQLDSCRQSLTISGLNEGEAQISNRPTRRSLVESATSSSSSIPPLRFACVYRAGWSDSPTLVV